MMFLLAFSPLIEDSDLSIEEKYEEISFSLETINVVLTKEASRNLHHYTTRDFAELDVKAVEDITTPFKYTFN